LLTRWFAQRKLLVLLQAVVTVAAAAFVIRRMEWHEVRGHLSAVSLPLLATSFVLQVVRMPLAGHRWRLLLDHYGHRFSTTYLTRTIFASQFVAMVLPGGSGVDLVRSLYLYRRGVAPLDAVGTVFADRACAVVSLLALSLPPAVWVAWTHQNAGLAVSAALLLAGAATAAYLIRYPPLSVARAPRLTSWLQTRVAPVARDLSGVLTDRSLTWRLLTLSLLFQLAGVLSVFLVGLGVGDTTGVLFYLLIVPVVWLWTTLPISLNGIGVREGAFVFYFGLVGMAPETALAISVLVSAQAVAQNLAGGLVLSFAGRLRPST
jgi:uncharacterized protein (TIRG00374 family)